MVLLPREVPPLRPSSSSKGLKTEGRSPKVLNGTVVWRPVEPPSIELARRGKRSDISALHDVASLHQEELQRVSARWRGSR